MEGVVKYSPNMVEDNLTNMVGGRGMMLLEGDHYNCNHRTWIRLHDQ